MSAAGHGKIALITGIAGQDGSYLAELLLRKGYEVHGAELPAAEAAGLPNLADVRDRICLHFGSLTAEDWTADLVRRVAPAECYHLAAASFVSYAFEDEAAVLANNIGGTHNLLAALKRFAPACRLFFAGTSEMFGAVEREPQDEATPFRPRSVYGISKVAGHHLVDYYRQQHGLFSCSGILYNHESPRRGAQFVTRKITAAVARIKLGREEKLLLGNLDARRDWGYAPDFVEAMWRMLQQDAPDDFVLATGELHTVRDFVAAAFGWAGLDWRDYVEVDPRFYREAEKVPLRGDAGKARARLNWQPSRGFVEMVREMVENDLRLFSRQTP